MALKGDRAVYITNIGCVAPSGVEAGQVLVYQSPQDSGHAVGQGLNQQSPQAVPIAGTGNPASGTRIIGMSLTDVENIYSYALSADGSPASGLTAGIGDPLKIRVHRNYQKTTQVVGENVAILTDGFVWTNRVNGTPAAGDPAYLGPLSNLQNTQVNSLPQVGKFDTSLDTDGYAKVTVKIV